MGFIRPMSSSSCARNSVIQASYRNAGSEGNSLILVRKLKSVSYTGYICSSFLKKPAQLELFRTAVSPAAEETSFCTAS